MQNKIIKLISTFLILMSLIVGGYFLLTESYPVLNQEVMAGSTVRSEMISTVRLFKYADFINNTTVKNGWDMVGKIANINLPANYPISAKVLETPIEITDLENNEALSYDKSIIAIPVDPKDAPSDLKKNDLINIIVYFPAAGELQAFTIGYNELALVKNVITNDAGEVMRVEVEVNKELTTDLTFSISTGKIFIIKNNTQNNINLVGSTMRDIYDKYFAVSQVAPVEE